MRTDAEQNKARILDVAREALVAERAPTMTAVARAAGVGQGTLYRHFPSWEALVMEVHRADMAELVELAPELLARMPPMDALRAWLGKLADYGRLKKGLSAAMHAAMREQRVGEIDAADASAIDLILDAGKRDGTIREDVSGIDVLLLVGFLWRLDLTNDRDERSSRLLDVVARGLEPPS